MPTERPKSKSGQLADILRARIASGEWNGALPPERALADEFLVSRTTLRKALETLHAEGLVGASESTRKGRQVAVGKRAAGEPKPGGLVIVLTPSLSNSPLLFEHLAIIREALARSGVLVEVREAAHLSEIRKPDTTLARMVAKHPGAVWILHKMPQSVQMAAQTLRLRCLVYGSTAPGLTLPFVDIDFAAVARHATGRCLSKGMSKIAIIVHRTTLVGDSVIVREVGRQLAQAGAPPPVVIRHDFNRSRLMDALDQRIVHAPDRPQVLFIISQHHLLTALPHLLRRGVRVPGDLSIIYFGNDSVAERLSPLPDRYDLGTQLPRRLAKAILGLLSGDAPAAQHLLPKMLAGESFACF
jgi:DNA-binding LacI/PurR family transcriptional regulator